MAKLGCSSGLDHLCDRHKAPEFNLQDNTKVPGRSRHSPVAFSESLGSAGSELPGLGRGLGFPPMTLVNRCGQHFPSAQNRIETVVSRQSPLPWPGSLAVTQPLTLTHHHDLSARTQGHLIGCRAWSDSVNEDTGEVPANDTYLFQQRIPFKCQHCDLAQDLASWSPPHGDTAVGRQTQPEHRGQKSPGFWDSLL